MRQLSIVAIVGTSAKMPNMPNNVPEIFDRNARMLRRRRANNRGFFAETMATDLFERLDIVQRTFTNALMIGDQPLLADGLEARSISYNIYNGDEDQLRDCDGAHDLILSSGTLDTVADLPGALILMRRALQPDGLLIANFAGAPSMTALRAAVASVDAEFERPIARFHPQIDVRSAGDLLMRAGFALPVADVDTMDIAYSGLGRLLTDLRDAAATNMLARRYPTSRAWLAAVDAAFSARADSDGRTHETLSYITLTAWAPAPSQPKPAKRGSGSASLSDALRRRDD